MPEPMASATSKLFYVFLRLINKKGLLKRQFEKGNFNAYASPIPPARIFRNFRIDSYPVNNRNVFTLQSRQAAGQKHILYIHGGAFVTNFLALHWRFLRDLMAETQCSITAPDYPLAPEHAYKDVMVMLVRVYETILQSVRPEDLIVMGDSAGGGIALALVQKLRAENVSQPGQVILLSPWLDLTLSNPEISALDPADPFIGMEGLKLAAKAYAGGDDLNDSLLSPINGSFDGLGRISVFAGTKEILVADARKLKRLLETKGVPFNYYEYSDMIHAWMFLPLPESENAKREIQELIITY